MKEREDSMRKLGSHKELKKGKTYNMVYTGSTAGYAQRGGNKTFIVTSVKPVLKVVEIFASDGYVFTENLRRVETT